MPRKFNWQPEEIAAGRKWITEMARMVKPAVRLDIIKEDAPDNRILECASAAGSDYIMSGDKDLLRLGRYDSIRIVRVAEFLELGQEHSP